MEILQPLIACHFTRQAPMNARASIFLVAAALLRIYPGKRLEQQGTFLICYPAYRCLPSSFISQLKHEVAFVDKWLTSHVSDHSALNHRKNVVSALAAVSPGEGGRCGALLACRQRCSCFKY